MIARALDDAQQLSPGRRSRRAAWNAVDTPLPPAPAAESLWTRLLSLVWRG